MRAIMAAIVFSGLIGITAQSAPAKAHDFEEDEGGQVNAWREQQWREHEWHEHEWHEQARERYAPQQRVYAPPGYDVRQPTYYAPPSYYPPPAYYAPPPPYDSPPGVTIEFGFGRR